MTALSRPGPPEAVIDLLEEGETPRPNSHQLPLKAIEFSTKSLESYAFAHWEPLIYDAMIVAAAVEYADRTLARPKHGWRRRFFIRVPVHDPIRWQYEELSNALIDALGFLTGDDWHFSFTSRRSRFDPSRAAQFDLCPDTKSVIAYSDGMDSRAVAGLLAEKLGNRLVRVRLGSMTPRRQRGLAKEAPFTGVPYKLSISEENRDSTARNRGFKFSTIAGIAAYLSRADEIILPESGQGAIGPALVGVAHAYPDYRNHPQFARKMEQYFRALFERDIRIQFPRLWFTKGETLREYISSVEGAEWSDTRSCWRGSRWVSVSGRRRQCGVCAACMLRRMSVHAAGLVEAADTYAATNLSASSLSKAVDPAFAHQNDSFEQYANAGFLHLDHLADLSGSLGDNEVGVHAVQLALALDLPVSEARARLKELLKKHKNEWEAYMDSLGERSFLAGRRRVLR